MNVVYLDQNIVIDLVDHLENNRPLQKARDIILKLVNSGRAVFPYSEIHLSESAQMDFESKKRIGEFWNQISKGYRFIDGKEIRSRQFLDVFHSRETRFSSAHVLFRDQLTFIQSIDSVDPKMKIAREKRLKEVVAYWATLPKENIEGHVRIAEATAGAELTQGMLNKILMGGFPSLGEIESDYNAIASNLAWEYCDKGHDDDALLRAIAFMKDNAMRVPAIRVECAGLEALAEQYASDANSKTRRSVAKSKLGHDSNDLAALSNFVPYCQAGISDGNAISIIQKAYRKLDSRPPILFRRNQIESISTFLEKLPTPETKTNPVEEAGRHSGKSLILVPRMVNELIRREDLEQMEGIQRQHLPYGGLKVWSSSARHDWVALLRVLERTLEELKRNVGNEAIVYGGINSGGPTQIAFETRIPCGLVDLARRELKIAFAKTEV